MNLVTLFDDTWPNEIHVDCFDMDSGNHVWSIWWRVRDNLPGLNTLRWAFAEACR